MSCLFYHNWENKNDGRVGSTTEIQFQLVCSRRLEAVILVQGVGWSLEWLDPRKQPTVEAHAAKWQEGTAEHWKERMAMWGAGRLQQERRPCTRAWPRNYSSEGISGIVSNLFMWSRRVFQSYLGYCPSKHTESMEVCLASKKDQLCPGSHLICCSGESWKQWTHICLEWSRDRRKVKWMDHIAFHLSDSWLNKTTFLDA